MKKWILLSCLFALVNVTTLVAQAQEVRIYSGLTYYQGDLSPQVSKFSLSEGHPAYGLMYSSKISNLFTLGTRLLKAKISGTDSSTENISRRRRNLSFESDVYEYGFVGELNVNRFFSKMDNFGLDIYMSVGLNIFNFNPRASINDQWYDLQPLGTEGQGLVEFPDKKVYSLTQLNIPFGAGLKFDLTPFISFGFEITSRWTFTDYLDDVSTSYVNFTEVNSVPITPETIQLANRTGELFTDTSISSLPDVQTGEQRGDPNDNDWYLFTGVYLSYSFGKVNEN